MTSSTGKRVRLGIDEIYAIMLYAATDSINAKFAVSQVCRFWRSIALDTAVLWSTFSIRTQSDAFRMLTVLDRTRRAPLSVSFDFTGRTRSIIDEDVPVFDSDDRLGMYRDFSPHMPRVRALEIDFGHRPEYIGSFEPLDLLFAFPIPCMEHLSVQWRVRRWVYESDIFRYRPVSPIRVPLEAALRLRSLKLTNVTPEDWSAVAVSTLEALDVDTRVQDPSMLRHVLHNCPRLTHLTLCPTDDNSFQFHLADASAHQMHSIQRVRLGMPFESIWRVLSPSVNFAALSDIMVSMPGNEASVNVRDIYDSLLRGFGHAVSCLMLTTFIHPRNPITARFEVQNEYSRTRRVEIARVNPFREHVRGFLTALSLSEHGLGAIRSLSISRHMWLITSSIFHDHCPNNVVAELTIVMTEGTLSDESFLSILKNPPAPEHFPCPGLAKLTLEVNEGPSRKFRVALAILGLIDRGNQSRPVEVCFDTRRRARWVARFQQDLGDNTSWVACAHCTSLAQDTNHE